VIDWFFLWSWVTQLYFEIEEPDGLRKTGFSKDGKQQHPQIVLGLLVSADGYPLAYEIFEGNKYGGHTLMPVLDQKNHDSSCPTLSSEPC